MLVPGERLGPYTIVDLLGVGGMGEVYRADDTRLNRQVAIKVLPMDVAADRAALERFRREARAVAALSHPNILAIFDVGSEAGLHYAVTELLEGETLRARMIRQRLSVREALEILAEVADGVAAAHAQGIVHRDLKPENIFITTTGRVKVLDFGIARAGNEAAQARLASTDILYAPTETGMVMGTVGYLAPEQVKGDPPAPTTDVFALGCILYEMIAGHVPFDRASSAHAMVALLHDEAPRLENTGDALRRNADALIQHCLAKDPVERFRDGAALAAAIRSGLSGVRLRSPKRAFPWKLTIAAAILLIIAVAAYVQVSIRNRQIDDGYDLRASDIRADRETRRIIALALQSDAQGNRPKAQELLEEAWRRPSRTPFPAAFLSSFNDAAGNDALAEKWARLAMTRIDGASPYESLLVRYLLVSDRFKELALSKSALELRPEAWRLRLAAAHIHLSARQRAAALRELQQIDVEKPDDRRLMLVLADRASLGDLEGAERDLRRSRLMQRPALTSYVEARIAWSRGDARGARTHYERASELAAAENSSQLEVESRMLAGVASLKLGEWEMAQRSLALAAARAKQFGLVFRQFECTTTGAYAAHRAGDPGQRDAKLEIAAALVANEPTAQAILRILAIRLGSDVWKRWPRPVLEGEAALDALIRARELWSAGDRDGAARELRRVRAEGVDATPWHEDAELLAADLKLPFTRLPADTPYPSLIRWLAIFDLPHA